MKKLFVNFCFLFIGILLMVVYQNTTLPNKTTNSELKSASTTSSPIPCGRDDKYIETKGLSDEELSERLVGDEAAVKFAKDNCFTPFDEVKLNLISPDHLTLVFWGANIGCGSCHGQTIYIFDQGRKMYEQGFDDPKVEIEYRPGKLDALKITQPIRSNTESMSSPTWGLQGIYEWFTGGDKPSLYQVSQVPIKYN